MDTNVMLCLIVLGILNLLHEAIRHGVPAKWFWNKDGMGIEVDPKKPRK